MFKQAHSLTRYSGHLARCKWIGARRLYRARYGEDEASEKSESEVLYMLKAHKRIYIAIICFVILGIAITGFRQQEKNEPPINKESIQEAVAPNSLIQP